MRQNETRGNSCFNTMALNFLLGWKTRSVIVFGGGGTLGPLLILVLLHIGPESSNYYAIRRFVTVTTPTWPLGLLEYSYGQLTTWFVILVTNVLLCSCLGLAVAFHQRAGVRLCAYALAAMLVAAYSIFSSPSTIEIVIGQIVLALLYFIANGWAKAAAAVRT